MLNFSMVTYIFKLYYSTMYFLIFKVRKMLSSRVLSLEPIATRPDISDA